MSERGEQASGKWTMQGLVGTIEDISTELARGPAEAPLRELRAVVAELVAIADPLGHPKLVELASMVEVMLAPVLDGDDPLSGELNEILRDYLRALLRLCRKAPSRVLPAQTAKTQPWVCLLEPDRALARELTMQIEHFGYRVQSVANVAELLAALDEERPYAVILDLFEAEIEAQLAALVEGLRARSDERLPIIAVCEHGDLESRLRAARAGADAYLLKPFDLHELIDQLDSVGQRSQPEPYHIVIVEDSPTQAKYYSAILQRAGMIATVVNDPLRVLDALGEHDADLVLMDMYMPHCNGMELAKVIRQVPRLASIPIVYLSAETEIDRQLDAMSLGGDDFLTKPINPAHLIRSVSIRAERARSLRSFMLTDTLTGLLNHTRIKEQLYNEVARARRYASPLAFAMLDIDHFKLVNDGHGHAIGDRVIKTLARVLQQRLRQTDFIGRYGGEEFAVILPDAVEEEAVAIIDQVRHAFGKIHQLGPTGVFKVTFSAGVACFPDSADAVQLARRADKALYAAKHAGRDRVLAYRKAMD